MSLFTSSPARSMDAARTARTTVSRFLTLLSCHQDLFPAIPSRTEPKILMGSLPGISGRTDDAKNFGLSVKAAARISDIEIVESFKIRLRVQQGLCPTCNRRRSNYYEGILQVRAEDRALTEQESGRLVAFVQDAIARRSA